MDDAKATLSNLLDQPHAIAAAILAAWALHSLVSYLTRPKNLPPFYHESPYIPWLGSLVQFATGPREFLERAAKTHGDCFTIPHLPINC